MMNQVKEVYNTKYEKVILYKEMVSRLLQHFNEYEIENVPRKRYRHGNAMASATSIAPIEIEDEQTISITRNLCKPSRLEETINYIHTYFFSTNSMNGTTLYTFTPKGQSKNAKIKIGKSSKKYIIEDILHK